MKKRFLHLFSLMLAVLMLIPCVGSAEEAEAVDNGVMREGLTALEATRLMGNGINLGNTLEACDNNVGIKTNAPLSYETYWGQPKTTQAMIDGMKAAGFDTIRIPVAWMTNATHLYEGDYTIDAGYMDRVEEVVRYARKAGMYVIINDHWDGGWYGMFGSESAETRALAWIMWNDGSWALTHSVGDTYNADSISEGLVATNAIITGEGKYTVGLDFTGTAQGYSASVAFAAIGISNGEALYPNYLVNIKEVRINGEIYRLKGRAYTTSDDGVCTRVNLYNEWVTSVPKTARLPGGNLAGATPTPINRNDAVIAEIKTIEIDFEYVPMN